MTESQPEKKIIVIPAKKESPQEQAKKRNLRVAAYCRVSTGDEEQLTSYEKPESLLHRKDHEKSGVDNGGYLRG